jgi:hypothetical protein
MAYCDCGEVQWGIHDHDAMGAYHRAHNQWCLTHTPPAIDLDSADRYAVAEIEDDDDDDNEDYDSCDDDDDNDDASCGGDSADHSDDFLACRNCGDLSCSCGMCDYECGCEDCDSQRHRRSRRRVSNDHEAYEHTIRARVRQQRDGHSLNPIRALAWNGAITSERRARLGFEFECDCRTGSTAAWMLSQTRMAWQSLGMTHARDYMISKPDGSVHGSCPAEFATVPCTAAEHLLVLTTAFPDGRFGGGKIKAWSNGSAGLHAHISKKHLGRLTAGKVGVFLHHPKNDEFLTDVVGRSANTYCQRKPAAVRDALKPVDDRDRYRAWNMLPVMTDELRAFRPSPRISSILKNLEFVEGLVEFSRFTPICATTARDPKGLEWTWFLKWLSQDENRKKYVHMHGWMMVRAGKHGDVYRSFLRKEVKRGRDGRPKSGFPEFDNGEQE